jgi:hypothetical protein
MTASNTCRSRDVVLRMILTSERRRSPGCGRWMLEKQKTRGPQLRYNALLFGRYPDTASIVSNERPILPQVFDFLPIERRHEMQKVKELFGHLRCNMDLYSEDSWRSQSPQHRERRRLFNSPISGKTDVQKVKTKNRIGPLRRLLALHPDHKALSLNQP